MQVSVETTSGLERKMTVSIPADSIDTESQKRLQQLARNVKLNGFRPGKVPFKVVKKRFGDSVRQEVIGELMQQYFYQAIVQEKVTPAGMPSVEPTKNEEGQDVEFVATFEVYPDVEPQSMAGVTIEQLSAEVTDEDLNEMLDTLRDQRATWTEVKRKAKEGDQVVIDFVGAIDGEEFAGGKAENHKLELGSGAMIPGFEDQLIDTKAGDEVEIKVTFPEDYQAEELAGKEAIFKTKVHAVNKKELPKVGELAEALGVDGGNINKMKEDVKANMERELKNALTAKTKQQVMDALLEKHEVDVPKSAIDSEIENMKQQMIRQYGGNEDMAANLPASMFEDQATRRVKLGLIIGGIIKAKEFTADDDAINQQLTEMASVYEQPEEVINWYKEDKSRLSQIEQLVLEQKVVDSVLAEATIDQKETTFQEVMNQQKG